MPRQPDQLDVALALALQATAIEQAALFPAAQTDQIQACQDQDLQRKRQPRIVLGHIVCKFG
jgi:hypothetical protein